MRTHNPPTHARVLVAAVVCLLAIVGFSSFGAAPVQADAPPAAQVGHWGDSPAVPSAAGAALATVEPQSDSEETGSDASTANQV